MAKQNDTPPMTSKCSPNGLDQIANALPTICVDVRATIDHRPCRYTTFNSYALVLPQ